MEFLNPKEIINQLPIKKDFFVADFGCGSGGWTIPLAKKVKDGTVYGIDILKEPLSSLQGTLNREGISNVKLISENIEEKVSISDEKLDLVLITNFLFQVENKEKVFSEARRVLKNEGLLVIIEWIPENPIFKFSGKVSPEEVKSLSKKENFELVEEFQAGIYHFGFIYKKSI